MAFREYDATWHGICNIELKRKVKMQVAGQIDKLIETLNQLKPELSANRNSNTRNFISALQKAINYSSGDSFISEDLSLSNQKISGEVPSWVDPDYAYDPKNPRKPNMRELMETVSGKKIEELYADPDESWKKLKRNISEILYGVLMSNNDTRDWSSIMNSKSILKSAREETGKMYEPTVDIQSVVNSNGTVIDQMFVIKDKNGSLLRTLPDNIEHANDTLQNFGATHASVPNNLEEKLVTGKFDGNLFDLLKNYDKSLKSFGQVALGTATENIVRKLSEEIPLDELAKL